MSQGFKFTPITFGFAALSSVIKLVLPRNRFPGIDVTTLTHGNYTRLLTSGMCYTSYPQLISSLILLYSFRQFERQMGSLKFGSFVLTSYVFSTLTQVGIVATASSMGVSLTLSTGPYFLVFSLLACYQKLVPKLYPSKGNISSVLFSEKSWLYFLALQLLLSEGVSSLCTGLSGLLTGYLYLNDVMSIQQFRLPAAVGRMCYPFTFLFGPTAASTLPNGPTPAPPGRPRQEGQGHRHGGANGAGRRGETLFAPRGGNTGGGFPAHQMAPPAPPSEEAIESLMNLGFERSRVVLALQSRDNNLEAAANFLLAGNE